jgi:5-methylcytosine-specific restriction endonuclease McrA
MAQEFSKKFYNSKVWKECRASFIAYRISIDGGLCQTCGKELGKIVHHNNVWLTPDNINNPMVTLNHANLKYDCQTCHNQEKESEHEKPRYYFEGGKIILIPEVE